MHDKMWINGICDRIMATLLKWIMNYHKGTVSATGRYLTKPGEMGPQPKEIDVPTRWACDVAWLQGDLEYLIKILEAKVSEWPVTRDLRANFPKWRNGRITHGGARIITIDMYFESLTSIYHLMEALRDGKAKEARDLSTIDLSTIK